MSEVSAESTVAIAPDVENGGGKRGKTSAKRPPLEPDEVFPYSTMQIRARIENLMKKTKAERENLRQAVANKKGKVAYYAPEAEAIRRIKRQRSSIQKADAFKFFCTEQMKRMSDPSYKGLDADEKVERIRKEWEAITEEEKAELEVRLALAKEAAMKRLGSVKKRKAGKRGDGDDGDDGDDGGDGGDADEAGDASDAGDVDDEEEEFEGENGEGEFEGEESDDDEEDEEDEDEDEDEEDEE